MRTLAAISTDILGLKKETQGLLEEVFGGCVGGRRYETLPATNMNFPSILKVDYNMASMMLHSKRSLYYGFCGRPCQNNR